MRSKVSSPSSDTYDLTFVIKYRWGEKLFVAFCPNLDIWSQGRTLEEARASLIDSCRLAIKHKLLRGLPVHYTSVTITTDTITI